MNKQGLRAAVAAIGMTMALSGCINLAPDYHRPAAPVPGAFPNAPKTPAPGAPGAPASSSATPAADLGWQDFFQDERLRNTISLALSNSRDLRVAVLDILKERAEYRIQAAALFPTIDLTGERDDVRKPGTVSGSADSGTGTTTSSGISHVNSVEVGFSDYEIDLFGRLRNLKEEAWQTYLSTVEAQRSTQITLVADVAQDWLTLDADMRLLKLAQQTYASQQKTYDLTQREHALGAIDALDVAQAEASVQSARADVATDTTTVAQARDALNLLVGTIVPDGDLPDGLMSSVSAVASLPAGIPSQVLAQRPDVLSAEHTLEASNADIGAARANFFPTISLTAAFGVESSALGNLFRGPSRAWSFEPGISLPIFTAGANEATLKAAKVTKQIEIADYEKTIQTAFSEVADALAQRATMDEQLDAQNQLVAADQKAYDLTMALYHQGSDSLIDALTEQRLLYTAQQTQVATQLSAQTSMVTLYNALGGGWYAKTPQPATQSPGTPASN